MNKGKVFLISGGPSTSHEQLTADFCAALAFCGKKRPSIAYIGTASGDSKSFFNFMCKPLKSAGAGTVSMAPVAKRTDIPAAKKILSEADAVFLSGGEVDDGMAALKKHGLDLFLTGLYNNGKVFFGISAGCIMMGKAWAHWDNTDDDHTASLIDCLGFVPFIFDAHAENEDWRELKCVLRLTGSGAVGHGLSNGGAYLAGRDGSFEIIRNAPVIFSNQGGKICGM